MARISGVSIATVSQVLNNGGRPVSEPTRQRVLQAARQLNYHPTVSFVTVASRHTWPRSSRAAIAAQYARTLEALDERR